MADSSKKFPFPYKFEITKSLSYATREVVFESQKKQVQQLAIKPIIEWQINLEGTPDEKIRLEEFFDEMGGNTRTFNFEDEDGTIHEVRFSNNKLSLQIIRDFTLSNDTHGFVVGFKGQVTLQCVI